MFNKFVGLIVVHPSVPVKTIKELIDYAKANPGKLNYSSAGIGNFSHLGVELFMQATGTKMVHVPFTGVGPGTQALIAGDVQVMFNNVATALQGIEAGQLRGLGIGELKRLPGPARPAGHRRDGARLRDGGVDRHHRPGRPAARPSSTRLAKETAALLKDPEVMSFVRQAEHGRDPQGPGRVRRAHQGDRDRQVEQDHRRRRHQDRAVSSVALL